MSVGPTHDDRPNVYTYSNHRPIIYLFPNYVNKLYIFTAHVGSRRLLGDYSDSCKSDSHHQVQRGRNEEV